MLYSSLSIFLGLSIIGIIPTADCYPDFSGLEICAKENAGAIVTCYEDHKNQLFKGMTKSQACDVVGSFLDRCLAPQECLKRFVTSKDLLTNMNTMRRYTTNHIKDIIQAMGEDFGECRALNPGQQLGKQAEKKRKDVPKLTW